MPSAMCVARRMSLRWCGGTAQARGSGADGAAHGQSPRAVHREVEAQARGARSRKQGAIGRYIERHPDIAENELQVRFKLDERGQGLWWHAVVVCTCEILSSDLHVLYTE